MTGTTSWRGTIRIVILAALSIALGFFASCVTVPVEEMEPVSSSSRSELAELYGEPGDDLVVAYYEAMNAEIERINTEYHAAYARQFRLDRVLAMVFSGVGLVGETTAAVLPQIDTSDERLKDASRITALGTGAVVTLYFGVDTILAQSNVGYEYQLERFSRRRGALDRIKNHFNSSVLEGLRSSNPDEYEQAVEELRRMIRLIRNDTYYEPGALDFT